jgi:beta-glucuronidase
MENMERCYAHIHTRNFDNLYHAEPVGSGSLIFTQRRENLSLDGIWKFTPDVFNTFLRKQLFDFSKSLDTEQRALPIDFVFGQGIDIAVPGSWNTAARELALYEGPGIFTKEFDFNPPKNTSRVFLRMGAANYEAKVFLNGKYCGKHVGGFTPFCLEVTEMIQKEKNRLLVVVDNTRRFEQIPSENYDWFNYGGITGSVDLIAVPNTYIQSFHAYLVPDGSFGNICLISKVCGFGKECSFSIPQLGVNVTVPIVDGIAKTLVSADFEIWSPDHPVLYEVLSSAGDDIVFDEVGFREIQVSGKQIMLNGKEVYLKGICYHDESIDGGRIVSDKERMKILQIAKELGCNALRLTHYPHNERMAKLADKWGILLWEEIPVYWLLDFNNPHTYKNAENQLCELIERDFNRASVIIWSVGNENPDTDERLQFMKKLTFQAKSMDPTRLVSAACLFNLDTMSVQDRLTEYIDIISFNEYYGWYLRDYSGLKTLLENTHVDKPLMITETGGGAEFGFHGDPEELFTEEHQAQIYEKQIEYSDGKIQGLFPWILFDFKSPVRMNDHQKFRNTKGIVAMDKERKKLAFKVLQAYYTSR